MGEIPKSWMGVFIISSGEGERREFGSAVEGGKERERERKRENESKR